MQQPQYRELPFPSSALTATPDEMGQDMCGKIYLEVSAAVLCRL